MTWKIDYEQWLQLNGDRQNIRVMTNNEDAQAILFIHGGPCGADRYETIKNNVQFFVDHGYTVVVWDQRASGKSYCKKASGVRAETYVQDCKELVEYLCKKLHQDQLILIGHSWGTYIGTQMCVRYPELVKAYVGVGQVVNLKESEQVSYDWVMEMAKKDNNTKLIEKLKDHGPVNGHYEKMKYIAQERAGVRLYHGATYKDSPGLLKGMIIPALKDGGYNLKETMGIIKGNLNIPESLMNDVYDVDFYPIKEFKMPFIFTMGHHDYMTPYPMVEKWYSTLTAPKQKFVFFEESAHSPQYEEPEKWNSIVVDFLKELDD